jgi:hypothetical protein
MCFFCVEFNHLYFFSLPWWTSKAEKSERTFFIIIGETIMVKPIFYRGFAKKINFFITVDDHSYEYHGTTCISVGTICVSVIFANIVVLRVCTAIHIEKSMRNYSYSEIKTTLLYHSTFWMYQCTGTEIGTSRMQIVWSGNTSDLALK